MQNYDTKVGRNDISTGGPGMAKGKMSNKMDGGEGAKGTGTNGRQSKIEGFGSGSTKGLGAMNCCDKPKNPKAAVDGFSGGMIEGKI